MRRHRDYPATLAEVEVMLAQSAIGSYYPETIGDWLNQSPEPLPRSFVDRLIATLQQQAELVNLLTGGCADRAKHLVAGATDSVPSAIAQANRRAVASRTRNRRQRP